VKKKSARAKTKLSAKDRVKGLEACSNAIREKFNIPCYDQLIRKWQRTRNPPFPAPDKDKVYHLEECFEWVQKYIIPDRSGETAMADLGKLALEADYRSRIAKNEREQMELKALQGQLIDRMTALRSAQAAFRSHHAFVRQALEKHSPIARRDKLADLGVAKKTVAAFHAWDVADAQKTIDEIEASLAEESKNGG
jgi:hypothetical protein